MCRKASEFESLYPHLFFFSVHKVYYSLIYRITLKRIIMDEELNFIGVSENVKKSINENYTKYVRFLEIFSEIDTYIKEKYGNDVSLGSLTADIIRTSKLLASSLKVAKSEATLSSDKEEIQELIDNLEMVNSFSGSVGESLLDIGQDTEKFLEDDDISNLIGASLV